MPVAAKRYADELLKEINADREAHGKAPFDDDKNGYILGVEVTPGNVHDSVSFDDVYEEVTERFPKVKTIVADSAYKTPDICKKVFDDCRVLSSAYKRPMTRKGGHEWWKYVYDEYYDCVICP